MDANLDKIAKDLYGKIQTRFSDIKIGDENAEVLSKKEDIPKARFFEFEYEEGGESLGTIAITLDADEGIVVQVSGDLVNDGDSTTHHGAYKFIRGFRSFAKDRLLNFDVQNIGKSNLDKRDYQFQAKRKELPAMPAIMENKLYGNNRMSYQDLGEARLVIKHSQPINMELPAGRTMHIDSIYIENAVGERFKYPFKHINGARALAEHIKHGGNPYDAIGKHITGLSEELANLRKFKGYVSRQDQLSEAMGAVTDRVIERIEEIKKEVQQLQRTAYYETFAESFEEQEAQMVPEEVQNDLIDRLTIRTFNEELKSVFPYIYKFVDESELPVLEIGADELLSDAYNPNSASAEHRRNLDKSTHDRLKAAAEKDDASDEDKARYQRYKDKKAAVAAAYDREMERESFDPVSQFENFIEDIVREDKDEIFSPNKSAQQTAIEKLNQVMSQELKGGPEGINSIESLKGLIDDPEFLNSLRDIDPDLDVRPLIQQYVQQRDANVATQLHFGNEEEGGTDLPPEEPMPAATAEPAPDMSIPPAAGTAEPAPDMSIPPAAGTAEPAPVAESQVTEGSAHGFYVTRVNDKHGQLKITKWLRKQAGLPKDAPIYFDDADLVWIDKTIVPNALVNPKLKMNDLLTAVVRAAGQGQEQEYNHGSYRPVPQPGSSMDHHAAGRGTNESKEDDTPPWDEDPKDKKVKHTTPGKHGQGYSQARHLARQGLANQLKKAKEAGATLETQLDFGDRVMTIQEICDECGMTPAEVGFEQESGLPAMLKYISGFYNREDGNFTIGGTRAKIRVKKAFEDGEFGNASPDDLVKVLKFIDAKDPSGHDEQSHVLKLAGVNKHAHAQPNGVVLNIGSVEEKMAEILTPTVSESKDYSEDQSLLSIIQLAGLK